MTNINIYVTTPAADPSNVVAWAATYWPTPPGYSTRRVPHRVISGQLHYNNTGDGERVSLSLTVRDPNGVERQLSLLYIGGQRWEEEACKQAYAAFRKIRKVFGEPTDHHQVPGALYGHLVAASWVILPAEVEVVMDLLS